jgi:hypothetical protein
MWKGPAPRDRATRYSYLALLVWGCPPPLGGPAGRPAPGEPCGPPLGLRDQPLGNSYPVYSGTYHPEPTPPGLAGSGYRAPSGAAARDFSGRGGSGGRTTGVLPSRSRRSDYCGVGASARGHTAHPRLAHSGCRACPHPVLTPESATVRTSQKRRFWRERQPLRAHAPL